MNKKIREVVFEILHYYFRISTKFNKNFFLVSLWLFLQQPELLKMMLEMLLTIQLPFISIEHAESRIERLEFRIRFELFLDLGQT